MTESSVITLSFGDEEDFQEFEWQYADGVLMLGDEEVDPQGLLYVIEYGLRQTLQDCWSSHAKAKDTTKAQAAFDKRWAAIVAGSIAAGTRASNPIAVEMGRLATLAVEKAVKAKYKDRKGYEKAKGKGAFAKARKAYVAKNEEGLRKQATLNVEAAAALAEVVID